MRSIGPREIVSYRPRWTGPRPKCISAASTCPCVVLISAAAWRGSRGWSESTPRHAGLGAELRGGRAASVRSLWWAVARRREAPDAGAVLLSQPARGSPVRLFSGSERGRAPAPYARARPPAVDSLSTDLLCGESLRDPSAAVHLCIAGYAGPINICPIAFGVAESFLSPHAVAPSWPILQVMQGLVGSSPSHGREAGVPLGGCGSGRPGAQVPAHPRTAAPAGRDAAGCGEEDAARRGHVENERPRVKKPTQANDSHQRRHRAARRPKGAGGWSEDYPGARG